MGLIKSVNDITYELQGQKTEKEIKKKQQTRKRLLKTDLYDYFDTYFKENNNAQQSYFYLLQNKTHILNQIKKDYNKEYGVNINKENSAFLKQNYFKILNSVKRQYFEIDKIKVQEEKQQLKEEVEAEQQKAYKWQIIGKIFKTIFYILLIPFWLCLLLVWCALGVNHKKYKRR